MPVETALRIADLMALVPPVAVDVLPLSLQVQHLSEDRVGGLVSQADSIKKDSQDAAVRCSTLETSLNQLRSQKDGLLKEDATSTLDALVGLIKQIEALYRFMEDKKEAGVPPAEIVKEAAHFVTACKSQSHNVFILFESMHDKARDVVAQSTDLSTDLTFQATAAQTRLDKLQELEELAKALKEGVEKEQKYAIDRMETAKQHIQIAQETRGSAERARKGIEDTRILRCILTIGISELLDIGDSNNRIKDAEIMIQRAEENLRECDRHAQTAQQDLQHITGEIASLETLRGTIRDHEGTLGKSVASTQELRTTLVNLINSSLEVSLFLAILAAKNKAVEVNHPAKELAEGVLNFAKVIAAEGKVQGLLLESDPAALQETLDMIAQSGAEEDRAIQTFNMLMD